MLGVGLCGPNMQTDPLDVSWLRIAAVDQGGNISESTVVEYVHETENSEDNIENDHNKEEAGGCQIVKSQSSSTHRFILLMLFPFVIASRKSL